MRLGQRESKNSSSQSLDFMRCGVYALRGQPWKEVASPGASTARWALDPRALGVLALLSSSWSSCFLWASPLPPPAQEGAALGLCGSGGMEPAFAPGPGLFLPPYWANSTTAKATAHPAQPPWASVPSKGLLGSSLKGKQLRSHSQKACQRAGGSGWSRKQEGKLVERPPSAPQNSPQSYQKFRFHSPLPQWDDKLIINCI